MTLRDLFKVLDSECEIELINATTDTKLIEGLRGMVDMICTELDWEVTHILPEGTTKIWVKRITSDVEEDF